MEPEAEGSALMGGPQKVREGVCTFATPLSEPRGTWRISQILAGCSLCTVSRFKMFVIWLSDMCCKLLVTLKQVGDGQTGM